MKEMTQKSRTKSGIAFNAAEQPYLVICTIFLVWNLLRLDLHWNLLTFSSHLVGKKREVLS